MAGADATAASLERWRPSRLIARPSNILIIAPNDVARRAAADILMQLVKPLRLDAAVVFTSSTDPQTMGNVLPEEVIFRNFTAQDGAARLLAMQRDAHTLRENGSTKSAGLLRAVHGTAADRLCVVFDGVIDSAGSYRSASIRDILMNGRHENIMNIVCTNVADIPATIRAQFDVAIMAYTNIISEVKLAHSKVFGMFESYKDLLCMINDLAIDEMLVADLTSQARTLHGSLFTYAPRTYQSMPTTQHLVDNRGRWDCVPDDEEAFYTHASASQDSDDDDHSTGTGADDDQDDEDESSSNRNEDVGAEHDEAANTITQPARLKVPTARVVFGRTFPIQPDAILRLRNAMRA